MRLELGSPVHCSDGPFGKLSDVVIDPTTRRVTHLVLEPHDDRAGARLVPIAHADAQASADAVVLKTTIAEVRACDALRESSYLRVGEFPAADPAWDVGIEETYALPFYAPGDAFSVAPVDPDEHILVAYDRIPKGEVEIRRESAVCSSDGHHVGHVDGFLVDDDEHITHLVLQHGHLWGKREVGVPIGAVDRVESDVVVVRLSRQEVGELAPVPVRRRHG
jgi:sporulation protein YlmC with PRC-barrel domain